MQVLLLSRYDRLGASSRLRFFQFLPYLSSHGLQMTVAPFFDDDYVSSLYHGKVSIFCILRSYWSRFKWLLRAKQFDLIWIEKEMLPWLPSWIELGLFPSKVAMVVDFDDAIFHQYDQHRLSLVRLLLGKKIASIMRRAELVIAGNDYLAEYAKQAGAKRVECLPTVVDVSRYTTSPNASSLPVTIGWIGSPNTARYLKLLTPVLRHLTATNKVRVVAVGAKVEQLCDLPIESREWSEDGEVFEIQQFDIGIMPLPDEPFERGKCGYKLIQYMACVKPVVASPVGVNKVIVQDGINGFFASSVEDWERCLTLLCTDAELRLRLGSAGRSGVEAHYSLQVAAPRLEQLLRQALK